MPRKEIRDLLATTFPVTNRVIYSDYRFFDSFAPQPDKDFL